MELGPAIAGDAVINHHSITAYRDLNISVSFSEGVEIENRRRAYRETKAREARARDKAYWLRMQEAGREGTLNA